MAKQIFYANKEVNIPATDTNPPLQILLGGMVEAEQNGSTITITASQDGKTYTWQVPASNFDVELKATADKVGGQMVGAGNEMLGMFGKMANNLWIPYFLIGGGMCLGTYVAYRKGSGFFGYMAWQSLFVAAGVAVSVPVVIKNVRIQADKTAKNLDKIAKK